MCAMRCDMVTSRKKLYPDDACEKTTNVRRESSASAAAEPREPRERAFRETQCEEVGKSPRRLVTLNRPKHGISFGHESCSRIQAVRSG
jgi:hypothetical protein